MSDNNKKVFIENLIYLCAEQNFRSGFPYYNQNFKKRSKLFHPAINYSLRFYYLLKFITSLIITEDFYSLIIGDFIYKYKFKNQFCFMGLIAFVNEISNDLFNLFKRKLINQKLNINELKFKSNHLNSKKSQKITELIVTSFNIMFLPYGFMMSMFFMSASSSITYLLTIGFFWSVLFSLSFYVFIVSYNWNLIYFFLISYYSRFLLKSENQSLKRMANQKSIRSSDVFTHLQYIDGLYRKIMGYNEVWSKFIIINWFNLQLLMGNLIFFIFHGDFEDFKYQLIYISCFFVVLYYVIIITMFCSSLNSEAKKSHKILSQIISSNKFKIIPTIQIKVSKMLTFK